MNTKGFNITPIGTKKVDKKLYNYDPADGVNIKQNINLSSGYIEYGAKDAFPNYVLDTVNKSHTANSCIDTRSSFLEGVLASESLSNTYVNKAETFEDIHHKVSMDYGVFEGAYIHVDFNLNHEITQIHHLPFEYCRLGNPNENGLITTVYFNPYFGTQDYAPEDTKIFPIFNNNPDVLNAHMEGGVFNGQVMFLKEDRPNSRFYPIPYYWSGHYWYDVERKIGEFHNSNIDNNFLLSVLIKFVGDPNQPAEKNDEGETIKTIQDVIDTQLADKFSGKSKGGSVMTLWGDSKEAFPEIEAFPTNTHDKLFESLQRLIIENTTIATNIPPILANISTSRGLSNTQEIENSVKLLQGKLKKSQRKLESSYDKIFNISKWGEQDTTINPFEYDLVVEPTKTEETTITE